MTATGVFQNRFPYVRIGAGERTLVVLPGLALDNRARGAWTARAYGWGFGRLATDRTVYIVQRPRGLPPNATTAEIAAEYAPVLDKLGRVDLMGLSTGGLLAQHLALSHPDGVERLVLVVTGSRLADAGRAACRRWLRQAAAGRWRELRGDLAAIAVDGPFAQWLARTVGGSRAEPDGVDRADFATTVAAVLDHDTASVLGDLRAPTLLVGGADDPFFPEPVLRATAAAISNARLHVHPGGHGLPKHRGRRLQDEVTAFLRGG